MCGVCVMLIGDSVVVLVLSVNFFIVFSVEVCMLMFCVIVLSGDCVVGGMCVCECCDCCVCVVEI